MHRLFVVVSIAVVLAGLLGGGAGRLGTTAQDATPTSNLDANKALARRFHEEIFDQGNLAAADEILTPDFVWRAPPNAPDDMLVVGPEGSSRWPRTCHSFIPNFVLSDDDEIAEGDRVVIRWTLTGTAQGDAGPVPVTFTGIDIFRIADGRLAELWQNTDDLGLEQQLAKTSVMGTPAATPTP